MNRWRLTMRGLSATFLLLGVLAAGCSVEPTEPARDGSWDRVRLHEGGSGTYSDLSIEATGNFVLESSSRGGGAPARGLLAGERLETLARLIGELPPEVSPRGDLAAADYFLSITRGGTVSTYRSEGEVPAQVESLRALLASVADEIDDPQRLDPGAVRVLASGDDSAIAWRGERVLESRDELLALLRKHQPSGLLALPPVDFRHEVVVALFRGTVPSDGYALELGTVETADNGWMTIRVVAVEPSGECVPTAGPTRPYLLLAARRAEGGLIMDMRSETRGCAP